MVGRLVLVVVLTAVDTPGAVGLASVGADIVEIGSAAALAAAGTVQWVLYLSVAA